MLVFQVSDGKILENDIPVFVISFATQEVLLFRNAKTGEIMVGADNKVEQCTYVAVVTRVMEELDNELTGGWKVIEVCYFARLLIAFLKSRFYSDGKEKRSSISLKVFRLLYLHIHHNSHRHSSALMGTMILFSGAHPGM
jgi:hypothetical protein